MTILNMNYDAFDTNTSSTLVKCGVEYKATKRTKVPATAGGSENWIDHYSTIITKYVQITHANILKHLLQLPCFNLLALRNPNSY